MINPVPAAGTAVASQRVEDPSTAPLTHAHAVIHREQHGTASP